MVITNENTLFAKHVIGVLCANGFNIHPDIVQLVDAVPIAGVLPPVFWDDIIADIKDGMLYIKMTEPARCATILTEITLGFVPGAAARFVAMLGQLQSARCAFQLAPHLLHTPDSRYALAAWLLMAPANIDMKDDLCEAASLLLAKPVQLGKVQLTWKRELAAALFGPVWESMYGGQFIGSHFVHEHVLVQRPAFARIFADQEQPPGLPEGSYW